MPLEYYRNGIAYTLHPHARDPLHGVHVNTVATRPLADGVRCRMERRRSITGGSAIVAFVAQGQVWLAARVVVGPPVGNSRDHLRAESAQEYASR